MYLVALLSFLFAVAFIIAKAVLFYDKPFFLMSVRLTGAGILLLTYYLKRNGGKIVIDKKDLWSFAKVTIFGIYLFAFLDLWSLQYLTSVKASFLFNLTPFIAALFSYFYFSEVMTHKKWVAMLIGFVGFFPLLLTDSTAESLHGQIWSFLSVPELVNFLSIVVYSFGWINMRTLVRDRGYSPLMVSGISMIISGVAAFVSSYFIEGWMPVSNVPYFLTGVIVLIFLSNIALYNLYAYLLKQYTATFIALTLLTSPLITAVLGRFFLGEQILPSFFFAAAVVPIGLYMFYKEEVRQGYIKL